MTRRKPGEGTIRTLASGRLQVGVTLADGRRVWSERLAAGVLLALATLTAAACACCLGDAVAEMEAGAP